MGFDDVQPEERHGNRVDMLKSALDQNYNSSGDGSGGLATQQYVQKSKLLLLKNGERVERLPLTTFASANRNIGGGGGSNDFDADDALFADMEVCRFMENYHIWIRALL